MNEPPVNGEGGQQIIIYLDAVGNLNVTCSTPNKIISLGMMAAAQHIIIGMQPSSPVLPIRRIIP